MVLAIIPIGAIVAIYGSHEHYGLYVRTIGFSILGSCGIIPLLLSYNSTPPSLIHIWNQGMRGYGSLGIAYAVGVFFYVIKFPEKQFPKFVEKTSFSVSIMYSINIYIYIHIYRYVSYTHSLYFHNILYSHILYGI